MHPVLTVKKLKKIYPGRQPFTAVDEISFEMKSGEILGLLGANGAGKTTTIQMLMSTLKPTSGEIVYFGKDFVKHRSEILGKVAFASTYVSLPWNLTVWQNLNVFGGLYGIPKRHLHARIEELLDYFGILEKKDDEVSRLSAGQITRLTLTKAFMVDPKIVLLDEPTASLDPDMAHDVCQFILKQRKEHGISILFTSHNMGEVAEVCDRVLFMQHGRIIADDLPTKLARSIATSKLQLIMDDGMKRTIKLAEEHKFPFQVENRRVELQLDESQIAQFLSLLAAAGVRYSSINIEQPTLEDYFIHMVTQSRARKR